MLFLSILPIQMDHLFPNCGLVSIFRVDRFGVYRFPTSYFLLFVLKVSFLTSFKDDVLSFSLPKIQRNRFSHFALIFMTPEILVPHPSPVFGGTGREFPGSFSGRVLVPDRKKYRVHEKAKY